MKISSQSIVSFLFILTLGLTASAQTSTVCSMTLNSPDELNVIKQHLGTANYRYVELGANPEAYCGQNLQCDIIVVSAHFGGHFFGDKGEISLEKVEELSCSAKCGNIFSRAKQVYLFGCNTLNGKQKDSRTPEQYVDVLRRDGYGLTQAQRLAANIYSPLGGTYHNRMQQVFPNASQIFGFYSLAPVGKRIAKDLDLAFAKVNSTPPELWAQSLTADLKKYSFTSTVGRSQADSLICKISNERYEASKLRVIREVFERGEGLKVATNLVNFFRVLSLDNIDSRSQQELARIRTNTAAREELLTFIVNSSDAFAVVRLELLEMMEKIGWVSHDQASAIATEIVLRLIPRSFKDPVYVAVLHPAVQLARVNFQNLPADYWNHVETYQVVEAFKAKGPFIANRMVESIRTAPTVEIAIAAGRTLLRIDKTDLISSQMQAAARILNSSADPRLRSLAQEFKDAQGSYNP